MKLSLASRAGVSWLALACSPALAQEQPADPAPDAAEEIAQAAPDAPEADADDAEGNAILVTATKRARTLQDTPFAVSVTTADTIERAQIRDLADLQSVVPSLKASQSQNQFATTYTIRGFGTSGNNIGLEPSVAIYIDGVYRSRAIAQIGDLPDVQRVEVLRGPQSTLFGKNASAGVISIVTREPSHRFGGAVEASYGNFNAVVAKAYVSGGLGPGIAASLAAGYNRRDGYLTNAFNGDDLNNRNRWFVRGQLRLDPAAGLRIRLIGDYDRIDEKCCGVVNLRRSAATTALEVVGGRVNDFRTPFADVVYSDVTPSNRVRNWGLSGQADYDFGPLTFTSITAYRTSDLDAAQDADFTSARLATGANIGQARLKTFTEEARVATNLDGPFDLLLGAYYFDENARTVDQIVYGADFRNYADLLIRAQSGGALSVPALEALTGAAPGTYFAARQGFFDAFTQHDRAYSLFASGDFKLGRRLTVTAGLNYTHDAKDVTSSSVSTDRFSALNLASFGPALSGLRAFQFLPPFLNIPNAVEDGRTRDGDWSWTARLAYAFNDRFNAYANYSTGFKASSFNLSRLSRPTAADLAAIRAAGLAPANLVGGGRFAAPEDSRLYELGLKGNWGVVSANLTVFEQTIANFQTNTFTGAGFLLGNAQKQSTLGIGFDAQVRPGSGFVLSLAATYLDPRYDRFTNSALGDVSGSRVPNIPPLAASVGLDWNRRVARSGRIALHADFNYQSQVRIAAGLVGFVTVNPDGSRDYAAARLAAQPYRREIDDLNASLTYAPRRSFELSAWARNLLDQRTITGIFGPFAQAGSISGYTNQPRTYGVTVRLKF